MNYPEIDPVLFDFGLLKVRWYGLMYLISFLVGWWLLRYRCRQTGAVIKSEHVDDLLFYVALGVILGGRLGYTLFYGFQGWIEDPLKLLRIWEGGMSFHGGFLGVLLAVILFGRKHGYGFFAVTDTIAPMVPVGLFAGRIGNFINGELWGGPTNLPWGMKVSCSEFYLLCHEKLQLPLGLGIKWSPPLHPSQLYEALLEGIVFFVILWVYSSRPRPIMAVSALFLMIYGAFRFAVEFVRMPDTHLGYLAFDWLTMGQLLSAPMVLAGLVMYWSANKRVTIS